MPKRPKSHRLESLSISKFDLVSPDNWDVVDKRGSDYGIDLEVQIFDKKSDEARGLFFHIQLKATSSSDEKDIFNYDLKIDHLNYYSQFLTPVLIVRYSEVYDKFYFIWSHQVDLIDISSEQKTKRIKFSEEQTINKETVADIENFVIKHHAFSKQEIAYPLPIYIEIKQDEFLGVNKHRFQFSLVKELKSIGLFQFVENKNDALVFVELSTDSMKVSVLDMAGYYFYNLSHTDEVYIGVLRNIGLGTIYALSVLGKADAAGKITFDKSLNLLPVIAEDYPLLSLLLSKLVNTSHVDELIDFILDKGDELTIQLTYSKLLLNENFEKNQFEKLLSKHLDKVKETDRCAYAYYNLGNFYRSSGKNLEAVHNYVKAYNNSYFYHDKAYFYSELGGVFFGARRFGWAVKCYEYAYRLEEDQSILPLLADALMLEGKYKKANELFTRYLEKADKQSHVEWILKKNCLDSFEIESQIRQTKKAMKFANVKNVTDSSEAKKNLEKALELDCLCALAWFNLAHSFNQKSDHKGSAFCYAMAALVQTNDIEAWVNASIASFNAEDQVFLVLIIQTAYFFNEEEFLEKLFDAIEASIDKQKISVFFDLINLIVSDFTAQSNYLDNKIVRLVGEGGSIERLVQV